MKFVQRRLSSPNADPVKAARREKPSRGNQPKGKVRLKRIAVRYLHPVSKTGIPVLKLTLGIKFLFTNNGFVIY